MEYSEGYLAFIDILGFSKYVNTDENGPKTYDLFEFVKKFCYLFNTSPQLDVQVSFFSDTIILTSADLDKLLLPIWIAESYLKDKLELLFRGGIVYGKYYHTNGTTFGPAVVSGYALENKAIYSRILISEDIAITEDKNIFYFMDIDGCRCINPYGMIFTEVLSSGPEGIIYPDNITDEIVAQYTKHRSELLKQIDQHRGSSVVEKYLWRLRPYNYTCNFIQNMPAGEMLYEGVGYAMNDELKEKIAALIIPENEVLNPPLH